MRIHKDLWTAEIIVPLYSWAGAVVCALFVLVWAGLVAYHHPESVGWVFLLCLFFGLLLGGLIGLIAGALVGCLLWLTVSLLLILGRFLRVKRCKP